MSEDFSISSQILFSRDTFRALAQGNTSNSLRQWMDFFKPEGCALFKDVIDSVYGEMRISYRNEYIYKNEIASRVVFGRHSPATASFCTELAVGTAVADVVVFNGTSTVYEIKTELDSLARLPQQIGEYLKAFDRVNVVTHIGAIDTLLATLSEFVGIIVLNKNGSMSEIRQAQSNSAYIRLDVLFGCMRQSEYLSVLKQSHDWHPDVARGSLVAEAKRRFMELPPSWAHTEVVKQLRKRTTDPETCAFVKKLPYALRAVGLSQPLSGRGRSKILQAMGSPLSQLAL